jgi:hypothetical protein
MVESAKNRMRDNLSDCLIERVHGTSLSDVFNGRSARPGCIPTIMAQHGSTQSLPATQAQPTLTPEQINPGLVPGLNASPQNVGLPTSPPASNKVRGKITSD